MKKQQQKTRYSEAELEEFRIYIQEILNEKVNILNEDKKAFENHCSSESARDRLFGEQGELKQSLAELIARQEKYVQALKNALIRIHNGTYGICFETGELILKERLLAVPTTTRSMNAKIKKAA